jgi:hypothetical protein
MIEKRKDKRVKEENRVLIDITPAGERNETLTANALTRDISVTGARIWTDRLYPLNAKLRLTLYLSRSRQVIRIASVVRWMKSGDDGLYEMGIQFQPGMPDSIMALIKHIYSKDQRIPTVIDAGQTT